MESTGKQYIDTEWTGGCTTVARYSAIWLASYSGWESFWGQQNSLANSRGSMWYPTTAKMFSLYACFDVAPLVFGQIYEVKHELCDGNRTIALSVDGTRRGAGADGTYDTTISYKLFYFTVSKERLYSFKLSALGDLKRDFIPAIDPNGRPCMFDLVTKKPFYNAATTGADFTVGLTTKQALNLENLPATGGNLTISLPLEAAFDANVQSVLTAAAADKGWNITVQNRESDLTTKNIEADFLESNGTQYIRMPELVLTNEDTVSVDFAVVGFRGDAADGIFSGYNYSSDKNLRVFLGEANNKRFLSAVWGTGGSSSALQFSYGVENTLEISSDGVVYNGVQVGKANTRTFSWADYVLFTQHVNNKFWNSIVKMMRFAVSGKCKLFPGLDSSGTPCMYDTVSGQNFYNENIANDAIPFCVGFDTTKKAAISLSKLPRTTGSTLYVALPAEAETDELVREAITIAEGHGWKFITQYRED